MDFPFSLNETFPSTDYNGLPNGLSGSSIAYGDIIKIGSDLLPDGGSNLGIKAMHTVQQRVSDIMDIMGQASAQAQDLRQAITSGAKLRMQDEHMVYLLIDRSSNGGCGSVVGMIKVGKKNLFLLDGRGAQKEVYPMCVLDFYVHESRQRAGCGRKLFEAMLLDQKIAHPRFLAIDRPSPKLIAFLKKHYNLHKNIPQVNNYVIFEGFFTDRPFDASPGPKRARIYMDDGRLGNMDTFPVTISIV